MIFTVSKAREFLFGAMVAALVLAFGAGDRGYAQSAAEDLEETIGEVEGDFNVLVKSVEQTTGKLDKAFDNLETADEVIVSLMRALPKGDRNQARLKEALRAVREMQNSVHDYNTQLKLFHKSAGHVTTAFDAYDKVIEIRDRAAARKGGPLAANLSVLADVMKDYGEKVPILGKALSIYGEVTGQLLGATDKLAGDMAKVHKQGILGGGTGQNIDDPRYLALKEQFPEEVGLTLIPTTPRHVFENNIVDSDERDFIWDDDNKQWYIVNGPMRASKIYSDGLMLGKRFTPVQLEYLTANSQNIIDRKETAKRFSEILNKKYEGLNYDETMFYMEEKFGRRLYNDGKLPDFFFASYAYDGAYKNDVNLYAAVLWAHARTADRSESLVTALEDWAKKAGVDLEEILPEDEKATMLARLKQKNRKGAEKERDAKKDKKRVVWKKVAVADESGVIDEEPPMQDEPGNGVEQPADTPPAETDVAALPQAETPTGVQGADETPRMQITPWTEADPRSVCYAYHKLA
ncbi:MAG: hypothetical protein KDJ16_17965, partial [Hyphomicrobiales bacterium]|nr:hypothetical protein [Hyphomicrobiales bacterium]